MANDYKINLGAQITQAGLNNIKAQLNTSAKSYQFNLTGNVQGLQQVQSQISNIQNQVANKSKNIKIFDAATTKAEIDKVKASFSALQNDIKSIGNVSLKTGKDGGFSSAVVNYTNSLGLAARQTMVMDKATSVWGASLSTTTEKVSAITKNVNSFTNDMIRSISVTIRYALSIGTLYAALKQLQDGVQYINDLNTELNKIRLVTGQTETSANQLGLTYNKLAKELGVTTLEVTRGSLEWIRAGKSVEETNTLLRSSTMLSALANIDNAESTELLTSTLNAYQYSAEEAITVVDKLVSIDNAASTSVREVAVAMKYSAETAKQAGIGFDYLAASIGTISSVTRISEESIGQALPERA